MEKRWFALALMIVAAFALAQPAIAAYINAQNSGRITLSGTGRLSFQTIPGLVGYWKLNQGAGSSALDSTANANTGTLTNMNTTGNATSGWNVTNCKYGNCLQFDGVNDYVNYGTAESIDLTGNYTISMWVKTSTTSSVKTLYQKNYAALGYRLTYLNYPSTGKLLFYSGSGSDDSALTSITSDLNNGNWRHLVFQIDGNTQNLYIDGILDNSRTKVASTAPASSFTIGYHADANRFFKGTIDDVRIYNRALTGDEVRQLYLTTTDR